MSHVRLIRTMVPVAETSRASVPSEACVATRLAGAPWAGAWGVGEESEGLGGNGQSGAPWVGRVRWLLS